MTQVTQVIPTFEEFPNWLAEKLSVELTSRDTVHYNSVTVQMKDQLLNSSFWKTFCDNSREYNDSYFAENGEELLKDKTPPVFKIKPFLSLLDKVYRHDVLENTRFPNKPESGWILPTNWFSEIDDILRTTIVVKYLDGVEYLANRLESLCSSHSRLMGKCRYIARIEGYYAAHLYFGMEFEIPQKEWETQKVYSSVEIQITTQVKEVIKDLLHSYYEKRRLSASSDDIWQWKYDSPEFATNYLGHIIHYVEGMIVGIRKEKGER
ncbi:MAG: hypothetical protein MUO17_01775 [Dehalococcoidales bacterium]|nr:hypothetical protein [Dehalococcoidales bacterium]